MLHSLLHMLLRRYCRSGDGFGRRASRMEYARFNLL